MAAASRRAALSPVQKRAEWIATHYPRTVVGDTLAAWAEAVGADAYMSRFRQAALYEPVETSLKLLDLVLAQRPDLRASIYDAYLPWVAKRLDERHKLLLRAHRDRAAASPHDEALRRIAASRDYGELLHARSSDPHSRPLNMEAIDGYTLLRDAIIPQFGFIGHWANKARVDLGRLSFDDAQAAARVSLDVGSSTAGADPHGVLVYAWPDGWTIRELKTKADLVDEGIRMGHCTKSYRPGDPTKRLFSLRDPKNVPHATMEWLTEKQYVNQLRGRGNVLPMLKHTARMAEFRNQMFPTAAPTQLSVPQTDALRRDAKFFGGRYVLPEIPLWSKEPFEVWLGDIYVGLEDIQEAVDDYREMLREREFTEEKITKELRNFQPVSMFSVELPPQYEWWFARRGPGVLRDNEDELAQAVRIAVHGPEGKPKRSRPSAESNDPEVRVILDAIRKPTGKPAS